MRVRSVYILKNTISKIKNIFKKNNEQKESAIEEVSADKYDNEEVNYLRSEEHQLTMLRSQLRFEYITKTENNSPLYKEYVNYVEKIVAGITIENKDEKKKKKWEEWLNTELASSYDKIHI